jgi:autophagy-related protein 9
MSMQDQVDSVAKAFVNHLSRTPQGYTPVPTEDSEHSGLLFSEEVDSQYVKHLTRDLDSFFTRLYDYYVQRGYRCIVVSKVLDLSLLIFFNYVASVLLLFVDWSGLLACRDHSECDDITAVLCGRSLMQDGSLWDLWSFVFVVGIWCFFASRLHGEVLSTSRNSIVGARAIQQFYASELHIQDDELRYMGWDAVVEKIVAQDVTLKQHDAADIANRIMRKDNYLIALMHNDVLPLKLPSLPFPSPVPQACIPVSLRPWIKIPDIVTMPTPPKVRKTPSWPRTWANSSLL